ncbi:MAG: lipid-A-disaccharide synthase N-terminal domain-containing protein [Planctomycetota bacterium]
MMYALLAAATGAPDTAGWADRWLNVTEPWEMWWLLLGLLAQVVFFGRWVIQWVASEVRRESVMPVLFWWCSLLGATMLLVYFVGRREPIGVLGQAIGWTVYSRNLYLIKIKRRSPTQDPEASAN